MRHDRQRNVEIKDERRNAALHRMQKVDLAACAFEDVEKMFDGVVCLRVRF
jgi:hypothetical protein